MTVRSEQVVELHDTWLRVHLPQTAQAADFHYLWLRHYSSTGRHAQTRELQTQASDLSPSIAARDARWNERGALEVVWEPDGLTSEYEPEWLARYAYATDRASAAPPPSTTAEVTLELTGAEALGDVVARGGAAGGAWGVLCAGYDRGGRDARVHGGVDRSDGSEWVAHNGHTLRADRGSAA